MTTISDSFGRQHNYLRISLTDACNFRCFYCMPNEDVSCTPNAQLMQVDEMLTIAKQFVAMGVDKIRLTGGEPLVRKEAREIIAQLSQLPVELCITTNGALIHLFKDCFLNSSIKSVNVSLDSLDADKFQILTKRTHYAQVIENIEWLLENDFSVKVNAVLIKGINDTEINDFIELTRYKKLHIRFIEFMPFTDNGLSLQTTKPDVYYLIVQADNGCSTMDSIEVFSDLNVPVVIFTTDEINCKNDSVQIVVFPINMSNLTSINIIFAGGDFQNGRQ